jgi:hypothetical protein
MANFKAIDAAAEALADTDTGWVHRRDSVEYLGRAAAKALKALHDFRDEKDVDVRVAVDEALGIAQAGLQGIAPVSESEKKYTFEELAQACHKPGKRHVEKVGDAYTVEVKLKDGRKQTVTLSASRRKDGVELIHIFTRCGPVTDDTRIWALKTNADLTQGALAVQDLDGEEKLVLMNCYLLEECSPREIALGLREIAFYGDWIEKKLTGLDEY